MWNKKDQLYNDQCNFVEYFWDEHPEFFTSELTANELDTVLKFFGAGKYASDEDFLKRRDEIIANNPNIEEQAIKAMHKVDLAIKAGSDLFGVELNN